MLHLYVYYKVRPADRSRLGALVRRMQALLSERTSARGVLLRRTDNGDDAETWMEVYENVEPDFEARLDDAVAKAGLAESIAGPRHVERFVDFDV